MEKLIRFLIYFSFALALLVFTQSCNHSPNVSEQKTTYQLLDEYFKTKHNFELTDKQREY